MTLLRVRTRVAILLGVTGAGLALAGSAFAHANVSPAVVLAKNAQVFTLAVPTEKENAFTTKVELTPPSGFSIDSFVPAPGWKRQEQTTGTGEETVVQKVTWTGGKVPTGEDALFQFLASTDAAKTYAFKVRQTYSDGSVVDWSGPESPIRRRRRSRPSPRSVGEAEATRSRSSRSRSAWSPSSSRWQASSRVRGGARWRESTRAHRACARGGRGSARASRGRLGARGARAHVACAELSREPAAAGRASDLLGGGGAAVRNRLGDRRRREAADGRRTAAVCIRSEDARRSAASRRARAGTSSTGA